MLASNIKLQRKIKGLSQGELGQRIGLKHNTISGYESGRTVPTADILKLIADELDIPVEVLFGEDSDENMAGLNRKGEDAGICTMNVISRQQAMMEQQQQLLTEQHKTINKLVDLLSQKER